MFLRCVFRIEGCPGVRVKLGDFVDNSAVACEEGMKMSHESLTHSSFL